MNWLIVRTNVVSIYLAFTAVGGSNFSTQRCWGNAGARIKLALDNPRLIALVVPVIVLQISRAVKNLGFTVGTRHKFAAVVPIGNVTVWLVVAAGGQVAINTFCSSDKDVDLQAWRSFY